MESEENILQQQDFSASSFEDHVTYNEHSGMNSNNNCEYIAATDVEYNVNVYPDSEQSSKTGRKRKLDDEGFVTPATPDIPKSSSKYEMPSTSDEHNEVFSELSNQDGYNEENPLLTNNSNKMPVYDSGVDLLKDKAEELKMVTLEWCREFGDSETFESFCVSRLEQLITDAHNLEENLKKQKEILRQRLMFISRTLQEI